MWPFLSAVDFKFKHGGVSRHSSHATVTSVGPSDWYRSTQRSVVQHTVEAIVLLFGGSQEFPLPVIDSSNLPLGFSFSNPWLLGQLCHPHGNLNLSTPSL